jgi:hypothetical protein
MVKVNQKFKFAILSGFARRVAADDASARAESSALITGPAD